MYTTSVFNNQRRNINYDSDCMHEVMKKQNIQKGHNYSSFVYLNDFPIFGTR